MKKVFLFAIAAVAISLSSCNGGSASKPESTPNQDSLNNVKTDVVVTGSEVVAKDSLGDSIIAGEVSVETVPANNAPASK